MWECTCCPRTVGILHRKIPSTEKCNALQLAHSTLVQAAHHAAALGGAGWPHDGAAGGPAGRQGRGRRHARRGGRGCGPAGQGWPLVSVPAGAGSTALRSNKGGAQHVGKGMVAQQSPVMLL